MVLSVLLSLLLSVVVSAVWSACWQPWCTTFSQYFWFKQSMAVWIELGVSTLWLYTWKRQKLELLRIKSAKSSPLIAYFCPDSTLRNNSSKIFDLPSPSFHLICDWGTNCSLQHRNCKCGSRFRRTHVSCYLSTNQTYSETVASTRYSRSVSKLQSQQVQSTNYSVLDYLLNSTSYDSFLELLGVLTTSIDSWLHSMPTDLK